ncbi:MAG: hypothetical protein OQK98_15885 [Gammaproteobacteria bacterium]|nr:hypothetical protein [Gammaproteobacteria bacterium]
MYIWIRLDGLAFIHRTSSGGIGLRVRAPNSDGLSPDVDVPQPVNMGVWINQKRYLSI